MFVDLDGFKSINDGYGHGAGDQLLVDIGRRLQSATRAYDCTIAPATLLDRADSAMYRAKSRGGGCVEHFDPARLAGARGPLHGVGVHTPDIRTQPDGRQLRVP